MLVAGGVGMASDSDDLKEALRQRLKLRRELAKGAKTGRWGRLPLRLGSLLAVADVGWAAVITSPESTTVPRGLNPPWLGVPAMELLLANLNDK